MAYNLQPLITILQQILDPKQTRWCFQHNKPKLQSLCGKAVSLQQILEKYSLPLTESLESQIRDAAHKAEDIIESDMVDRMLSRHGALGFAVLTADVEQATQELDSVTKQVEKLVEVEEQRRSVEEVDEDQVQSKAVEGVDENQVQSMAVEGVDEDPVQSKAVVGVDDAVKQLRDRLIADDSELEIVPIVGMGGIGKTTLARKLYQDPAIVEHFTSLAWTTVSQNYDMKASLLSLVRCIIGKESSQNIGDLKDELYKSLYGRRYMIILDDMWSTTFWDEVEKYFPDNGNGSRIVITTRGFDVSKHADLQTLQHEVQPLSESASWDLLRQEVFGEDYCPRALREIGKRIARDCSGLPLAINVIGGLLSEIEESIYAWENIANNVASEIAEADERFSNILSLSYNHLQNHLKPCFLYMAAFPEDYEIKGSRLVRMWVAEGLVKVKPNGDKSLEEEAENYLKALVARNLVLVREYKYEKPKSYHMHDMLRDLCIKKAKEEKFLHVKNGRGATFSNPRRVSVHISSGGDPRDVNNDMSLARSFIGIGQTQYEVASPALSAVRLVRVLDVMDITFEYFPTEIFELVNLRFLAVHCNCYIPSGISRLWNLQTLIADSHGFRAPSEIWELSELRHLKMNGLELLNDEDLKRSGMKKMQLISRVLLADSVIKRGFFRRIPNVKKLGFDDGKYTCTDAFDISHLHKLEILRCNSGSYGSNFLPKFKFPCNIRKLILDGCVVTPRVVTDLCRLDHLEVLKIRGCFFDRDEEGDQVWEVAKGDKFGSLQFLNVQSLNLVHWRANKSNFPKLRHLCLKHCRRLLEIPSSFEEVTTLRLIELYNCTPSVEKSAKQIKEELQSITGASDDPKLDIKRQLPLSTQPTVETDSEDDET